jgi:energy-coupling factor transporter ATP-binding protein EcfA2
MLEFDDYLGLDRIDLARFRLLVFTGRSGSGKSTAIGHLLSTHPSFRGRESAVLRRPSFEGPSGLPDVVAVDDLVEPRELRVVVDLLRSGRTILVASHLDAAWYRAVSLFVPAIFFRTDADEAKIGRYLEKKGVAASEDATRAYVRRFGATYTDADIILERYPGRSFDDALTRFDRYCELEVHSAGA